VHRMNPKFKPGAKGKANYSETNFRFLSKILEVVTNKKLSDLLSAVFVELEMNNTFVLPSESAGNCAPVYYNGFYPIKFLSISEMTVNNVKM
ncbi:MAG TPA: hypothetical protein VLZ72_06815, partial [Flavobacterium sp.]|nr:hypothetical protein [Flavobacterium sp.]